MEKINIEFEFSLESEVRRVMETISNLEWFKKNNYRVLLPNNLNINEITSDSITRMVESEFDIKNFQEAEVAIRKSWEGNNVFINKINKKIIGSFLLEKVKVILTRYGTQGSYVVPDSLIINISNIPPQFLIKTVIHESLHLMLESFIKKYSVDHWVKERIVDSIMNLDLRCNKYLNMP
ncbi:MAG TPA: hypothetical protein VI775_00430 [Candidatus Paceibacterota bacterium]